MDAASIKAYARELGLPLCGVAPIGRFEGIAAKGHPASILPEAKSVIVLGADIPRGQYRGIEEGTLWTFADKRVGARLLRDVARFVERSGFEAVPVYSTGADFFPKARPVAEDRPLPNVLPSPEYAAVAAGLGEIGFCGLLLTPEYGPRQSLGMVVTELELEPDPVFSGSICAGKDCAACAKACPSGAIDANRTVTVDICGRKTVLADINYNLCRLCQNGAVADFSYKFGHEELMPDMAGNQPQLQDASSVLTRRDTPNLHTALCNRTCIDCLEQSGKLNTAFAHRFRARDAWKLDVWER